MSSELQVTLQRRVVERMKELSDAESRWHRSLWSVACVTVLDELLEATRHTWSGALSSDHAFQDFKRGALRVAETDVGIGSQTVRNKLTHDIKQLKAEDGREARNALSRIAEWRDRIAKNYLRNWADHIEKGGLAEPDVELAARGIVTHLRSLGYSRGHILGWLRERGSSLSAPEMAREAAKNLDGTMRDFSFLVASSPLGRTAKSEGVLQFEDLQPQSNFFREAENVRDFDLSKFSETRAVRFAITAPDPLAAVTMLQLRVERIMTRYALAEGQVQRPVFPVVYEETSRKLWHLKDQRRLLSIPGLHDWKLVTSLEDKPYAESLTETLHLLAPQLQAAHGVSLATLWASCEALLGRPQQGGHLVAPRLAAILACAYPRHLAYDLLKRAQILKEQGEKLSCRTGKGATGLRAFVADLAKGDPGFTDPADAAAFHRYTAVNQSPREVLGRVTRYLTELFLRVYYHRNFVMHTAATSSVSLNDVAGLAPVLVAAALNEMVSGLARDISPNSLAERAIIELELLETDASKPLLSLLG